jgi:hypothetical protein
MAEKESGKSRQRPTATPEEFTTAAPSHSYPSGDYSYTVELVGTINRELGGLIEAVNALKEQSKSHTEKIDKLSHTVYGAKVGLWIIGGIVATAGSVCGFILKMIFDAVVALKAHP